MAYYCYKKDGVVQTVTKTEIIRTFFTEWKRNVKHLVDDPQYFKTVYARQDCVYDWMLKNGGWRATDE
jgi:hypothetical protein